VNQPSLSKFQQRLAQRREEEARKAAQEKQASFDADLVPEEAYERSETDQEMDQAIESIDIIDAYRRWCGKMEPKLKGDQREGIKISCPIPGHIDSNPSAWINLDKQVWHCGGCEQGGDKYDLAAFNKGFPVPGYKDGAEFHKLRELMAADFGFSVSTTAGGQRIVIPPVDAEPEPQPEPDTKPAGDVVVPFAPEDDDEDYDKIEIPVLDWQRIIPQQSFLDEYMKACVVDDAPDEYHFFHGLLALGFALGRDVTLFDSVPVYGNLFICTLGRSGTGKSKAKRHLDQLLAAALPYDRATPVSRGVLKVSAPGSAESLIFQFMKPEEDPTNPKRIIGYLPVRGLVDFNELSSLVGRTKRQGSVLTPTLLQFYDMEDTVATSSMTSGTKIAKNPFASAVTTSQPRSLRGLLDATDDTSGFLNRWLFVPGREKKRFAIGGVQVDVTPAVKPLQDIQGWAATFPRGDQMMWGADAIEVFSNWFYDEFEPIRKAAKNELMNRMDLTVKKLCLLLSANKMEPVVSGDTVREALMVFPYLRAAYGIPEGQMFNTANNEIADLVVQQVKRYSDKGGITYAKLWDNIKHRKYDRKRVQEMVGVLVKEGTIEEIRVNTGKVGRPTVRYKVAN
jgi:hypothetical protein